MQRLVKVLHIILLTIFLYSCTGTRRFGTTIERDEKNPCVVNLVIQIGIAGTDADVAAVKADLERCYGVECFIPCPGDSTKGCKPKISISVKKWGSLPDDEMQGYHYVQMVDNDGMPSTAYFGRPNVNTSDQSCMWRRDAAPGTYCHEVLHLCGLPDKYCSRIYDPVLDSVITEIVCDPPPDPGGNCCTPGPGFRRCTVPCAGHESDIMGTSAPLSCDNILDVLTRAGFNNCPPECCGSDSTFTRPPPEAMVAPGYFQFNDKYIKSGSFGIGVELNYPFKPSLGITINGGAYIHTEKQDDIRETDQYIKVTGGMSWTPVRPLTPGGWGVTTHFTAGILHHTHKTTRDGEELGKNSATAFCLDIGAALKLRLSPRLDWCILKADYIPSFFNNNSQHNFRASTGLVLRLSQ